ncbi:MAG: T9SS type A sorting domain-containing protein [Candidatus Cloacimonadaceae bacterium]
MKKGILITIIIAFCLSLLSGLEIFQAGSYRINNIPFSMKPSFNIRTGNGTYQSLMFSEDYIDYPDSCIINYGNDKVDITLRIKPNGNFRFKCWQVYVHAGYKQDLLLRDFGLKLNFQGSKQVVTLKGPQAILTSDANQNRNLYPYTDMEIEYKAGNNSFWIIGSNYTGCKGVEWISDDAVYFYHHTMHFARFYNTATYFDQLNDYKPCSAGQQDSWSFLIFGEKPYLLSVNRWLRDGKAAFAFTNDADGEAIKKLRAVYFGSSNPNSAKFLTEGFIANNIKVSNTVFGGNIVNLGAIWDSILVSGNSIGYHTATNYADQTAQIANNLLNEMVSYHVRLWIDHNCSSNPEDFCVSGGNSSSPYYILDVINQSYIDYAWAGDTPSTNPFNCFDEPWRLPHRLYSYTGLTKPVWFFGRTRMECWEYLSANYSVDMVHNLTPENLDKLLEEKGLCIAYTHFGFNQEPGYSAFYNILPNGDYEIKPEVNDMLQMMDYYQTERGLWIDTVENIFDRMLAIENVEITAVQNDPVTGLIAITLENKSEMALQDVTFELDGESANISSFPAHGQSVIIVSSDHNQPTQTASFPFDVFINNNNIYIKSRNQLLTPPLKVKIYNLRGQLVTMGQTASESSYLSIPFTDQASGIYFAKIFPQGGKNQICRFRVIK